MFGRKHSEEAKRKMSEKKKLKSKEYSERLKGNSITKGRKLRLSDEVRQDLRDRISKVNSNGFINKGGRCKFYQYAGIDVQGKYELIYLRRLILSGITPKKGKPIKTPYGFYIPDFDLGDKYVEVKSTYTIKTSVKNGQYRKILWVKNNIKQVEVVILKENEVEAEFELLQYSTN